MHIEINLLIFLTTLGRSTNTLSLQIPLPSMLMSVSLSLRTTINALLVYWSLLSALYILGSPQ